MVSGKDIVEEARKWIGTPWRHVGRSEHGLDCVGLGVVVARGLGITQYDARDYSKTPNGTLIKHFERVATEVPIAEAQEGDFYVIKDGPYPFHVAFLSYIDGRPHIIHANARRRKVVEEPYTHEWPRLTTHCFRLKGIK